MRGGVSLWRTGLGPSRRTAAPSRPHSPPQEPPAAGSSHPTAPRALRVHWPRGGAAGLAGRPAPGPRGTRARGPGPAGQQRGRRPGRGAPPGGASARATRKGVPEGAPRGRAFLGRADSPPPRPPSGCAAPLTRPPSRGSCRFHGYAPREVRAPQAVRGGPAPAGDGTHSRAALSHAPRAPRTPRTHPAHTPHPAEHAPLTGAHDPRARTRPHPPPGQL